MVGQFLHICEIAFVLIAACSGLVAPWFELRDRWQTDTEREKTKVLYGEKWEAIRDSGLLQLPEKAIMSALDAKTRLESVKTRQAIKLESRERGFALRAWGTLSPKPPGIYRVEVQSCTDKEQAGPSGPAVQLRTTKRRSGCFPALPYPPLGPSHCRSDRQRIQKGASTQQA